MSTPEQNTQAEQQQATELDALAAEAAAEDYQPDPEQFASEGEYPQAQPEISTGELCTALFSIGFSLVASRRGQHWALNETEAQETGQAVGAVLDKYFPDMANHGPELTALLTVGAVITPRLMIDQQEQAAQEKQHAQQATRTDEKPDAPAARFDLDMQEA